MAISKSSVQSKIESLTQAVMTVRQGILAEQSISSNSWDFEKDDDLVFAHALWVLHVDFQLNQQSSLGVAGAITERQTDRDRVKATGASAGSGNYAGSVWADLLNELLSKLGPAYHQGF